ncbi:hypothetical protein A5755_27165 [Mycolicibacterium fortuitum]|nr:hypothetical protein A5668_22045 [Mycolicibacterium fortuitum]OBB41256.1 hypothetical protein A5754_16835 [Mycolicibacterium fortuitum]OBB57597.1 hypothetical protein A5755_27165 [Mycolicibacterium fortuitum]OBF69301.1 hypothetical protein A5751_32550 [Mycolicibacterium fortuitum]
MTVIRSMSVVLALLLIGLTANVAAPAWACGCGAYIPDRAGASVADERALVAWDGATEDILMSFNVQGSSSKAAWIMPVPTEAEVTLGESAVFSALSALSSPRVEYRDSWWPTFGWLTQMFSGSQDGLVMAAAPDGVTVRSQQRLGPFNVTRLASADPHALATWLTQKGFAQPPSLADDLAPYVAEGWEIVAVQLFPDAAGQTLTGELQPLRLSFASDTAIYPMRLSRAAQHPLSVDLYVLAGHRMDPTALPVAGGNPTLQFAGRISSRISELNTYLEAGDYLTRWTDTIDSPASIDGDYAFAPAAADNDYRAVVYRERDRGDVTGLALYVAAAIGAVAVLVRVLKVRGRRQAR